MPSSETLPQLLHHRPARERLGVSIRHIRRLVAERRVPYLKVGWLVRFDSAEIAAWLDDAPPSRLARAPGLIWPSFLASASRIEEVGCLDSGPSKRTPV